MSDLTVFVNVFFRNEASIADYYTSVRDSIGDHVAVFLINNVSEKYPVEILRELGKVLYVDDILKNHKLNGAQQFMQGRNSKYVRHFFAGIACCETRFFSFFDPDNVCENYAWIGEAKTLLKKDANVAVVCPYWEAVDLSHRRFKDSAFSDQFFVGDIEHFRRFDYSLDSFYSWMYPLRQNGHTFESAVFSNMLKAGLRRLVLCGYAYSHANEGQGYAKLEIWIGIRRFLARAAWSARSALLRDRIYE
jgi:hypothetical protein